MSPFLFILFLDLELKACANFNTEVVNNISDGSELFHIDLLKNQINELCVGPLEKVR